MSIYPLSVLTRLGSLRGRIDVPTDAAGRDASFICGSYVEFLIGVDPAANTVTSCAYRTNGCGFMSAVADVLAERVDGEHLADLHGLDVEELASLITDILGELPADRTHCREVCIEALRSAFAAHRSKRVEEFRGEKALICTCFGIAEETIEGCVRQYPEITVEEIGRKYRAGSGCGSCRMLIQEIIDARL